MNKLTLKQETAVQAYLYSADDKTRGNKTGAYKSAYNTKNMGNAPINLEAHRLFALPKVALIIDEERTRMAEQNETTAADIVQELNETLELARNSGQAGAAVSASMGKAKLLGFITDKVQQDTTIRTVEEAKPKQFGSALKLARSA